MNRKRVWRRGARPGGTGLPGDAPRSRTASRPRRRDRGQAAIEYLGFLPILLLVGLAGLQLGLAAYAAQQAGTAARAAARAATRDVPPGEDPIDPQAAADAAVSGWIDPRLTHGGGGGEYTATVTVRIPQVVPFWTFDPVVRTATMPLSESPEEDDLP
ncbi:TadE/TadG family type IV pilus assembly protein [Streptomyces sp. NPDC058052]|uniref:TadE/TadG family type IV pilus assembly protein n=1 Tax=Streptomyces sp. NPDC058052 TaxID=3346316 RepID=UPI0036E0A318